MASHSEEWRPVDHEGLYSVSSLGRVRSERRQLILRPQENNHGYLTVTLSNQKRRYVHHLVAEAFIGERPDGNQINHIDGDKQHNGASNLEYVTPKANGEHASRMHLLATGERHYLAKLNRRAVAIIRKSHETNTVLARRFDVSPATIHRARYGECWGGNVEDGRTFEFVAVVTRYSSASHLTWKHGSQMRTFCGGRPVAAADGSQERCRKCHQTADRLSLAATSERKVAVV